MGEVGMHAGLTARILGIERAEGSLLLNDSSLYLRALEHGWIVADIKMVPPVGLEPTLP
jgi:hypothetical protein